MDTAPCNETPHEKQPVAPLANASATQSALKIVRDEPAHSRRMGSLFAGEVAYRWRPDGTPAPTEGKRKGNYAKKPPAAFGPDDWDLHLAGEEGLVVVPIGRDNRCWFGALDIDEYPIDHAELVARVGELELPLVVCRSKSGGAHLYLFLAEAAEATQVRAALKRIATRLGYPAAEVFPKQDVLGDNGSGINVPYFGGDGTTRCGVKQGGLAMSLEQFLQVAERARQPPDALGDLGRPGQAESDPVAAGRADAEQRLSRWSERLRRAPPSGANNVLAQASFDIARYCRDTDMTEDAARAELLRAWTFRKQGEAGADGEFADVWGRQFTVGTEKGLPASGEYTGLPVFEVVERHVDGDEEALYRVQIDGEPMVTLTPGELIDQRKFNVCCLSQINRVFPYARDKNRWIAHVQEAIGRAEVIQTERAVSTDEIFRREAEEFLTNRHRAETRDEIILGRPWEDQEHGRHVFRLKDLKRYLDGTEFKTDTEKRLAKRIRALGGDSCDLTVKGKSVSVFWVPSRHFSAMPTLPPRSWKREPL